MRRGPHPRAVVPPGGKPTQEFVREKGVSEQTFYRWRSKYGGMDVKDSRRLKELEQENLRLKKIVAERDL